MNSHHASSCILAYRTTTLKLPLTYWPPPTYAGSIRTASPGSAPTFDMLSLGRINPKANVRVIRELPGTATVDGDNGLGLVTGPKANVIAMEKALAVGSGWVSVRNSNHFGLAGYYPLEALERGLIGWAMTNSTKLVAPLWGAERMLGTNPIAIAFPGSEEPPIVIDMATSATAYGKIEIALRAGQPIPEGWAIDPKATRPRGRNK